MAENIQPKSDKDNYALYNRVKYFPKAMKAAKRKIERLEQEAREMRATHLLRCLEAANAAWEREAEIAKLEAFVREAKD
jgi:hypothetical protein